MATPVRLRLCLLALCLFLLPLPRAHADSIWACVDQVSTDGYSNVIQNFFHTHIGENRNDHTPAYYDLQQNILNLMQSYGLTTTLDAGSIGGYDYNNLVGIHAGTGTSVYVVGAHYDFGGQSGRRRQRQWRRRGAQKLRARASRSSAPTPPSSSWPSTARSRGCGGARLRRRHSRRDIRGMISMDMIAYNPVGRATTGPCARSHELRPLQSRPGGRGRAVRWHRRDFRGGQFDASDHAPFEWQGVEAALLIEYNYAANPYYHSAPDSVDTPGYLDYTFAGNRGVVGLIADQADSYAPEPTTTALMASALVALGARIRSRRRARVIFLRFPGR